MKLFINELTPDEISLVESRMRPQQWSHVGFLDHDQSLLQIYNQDNDLLINLNIAYNQITDKIISILKRCQYLKEKFNDKHSHLPLIDHKYIVIENKSKGYQVCPFSRLRSDKQEQQNTPELFSYDIDHDCADKFGSVDYTIHKIGSPTQTINFPSLIIHLINDHHFFEGGAYRTSPSTFIQFFDLHPGINYSLDYKQHHKWSMIFSTCDIDTRFLAGLPKIGYFSEKDETSCKNIEYSASYSFDNIDIFYYDVPTYHISHLVQSHHPIINYLLNRKKELLLVICHKSQYFNNSVNGSILREFIMDGTYIYVKVPYQNIIDHNDNLLKIERIVRVGDDIITL